MLVNAFKSADEAVEVELSAFQAIKEHVPVGTGGEEVEAAWLPGVFGADELVSGWVLCVSWTQNPGQDLPGDLPRRCFSWQIVAGVAVEEKKKY